MERIAICTGKCSGATRSFRRAPTLRNHLKRAPTRDSETSRPKRRRNPHPAGRHFELSEVAPKREGRKRVGNSVGSARLHSARSLKSATKKPPLIRPPQLSAEERTAYLVARAWERRSLSPKSATSYSSPWSYSSSSPPSPDHCGGTYLSDAQQFDFSLRLRRALLTRRRVTQWRRPRALVARARAHQVHSAGPTGSALRLGASVTEATSEPAG